MKRWIFLDRKILLNNMLFSCFANIVHGTMVYTIVNIKISLKFKPTKFERIHQNCQKKEVKFKTYNNFIQYYDKGSLRFSVFKTKLKSNKKIVSQCGNLTGMRNLCKITPSIVRVSELTGLDEENITHKVDNITANAVLSKPNNISRINLQELTSILTEEKTRWTWQPEKCSAVEGIKVLNGGGNLLVWREVPQTGQLLLGLAK